MLASRGRGPASDNNDRNFHLGQQRGRNTEYGAGEGRREDREEIKKWKYFSLLEWRDGMLVLNGFLCPSFKIKFAHGCNFKNFQQIKSNQNHKI